MTISARFGALVVRHGCFSAVMAASIVAGRASRIDGSDISLVWPAAAVSAIWMLTARSRKDSAITALTLTACSMMTALIGGAGLATSTGWALVTLTIGGGTAFLLGRRRGARLEEPADLGWALLSVTAAAGVAAVLGGLLLHALNGEDVARSASIFWLRNGVTAFLGVALLATYPRLRAMPWVLPPRRRLAGDLAVWVFAVTVYAIVFVVNVGTPVAYFVLPVGVLIGLRWSTAVVVWHMLASDVFVLLATVAHRGPFVDADPVLRAALAQGLIGCALLVVLTVALYRDSREQLLGRLEQAHHQTQVAAEQLRHAALHDSLTGLANRQRLMEVLHDELVRAHTSDTRVGVIFLDLDGFKAVNDRHGHAEGDLLLDAVATRLRVLLREGDFVARQGGDEFVMVCPGLRLQGQVEAIAERVADTLATPYLLGSGTTHTDVGASLGTALSSSASSVDQLLRDADAAMYDVKRSRRRSAGGEARTASHDLATSQRS